MAIIDVSSFGEGRKPDKRTRNSYAQYSKLFQVKNTLTLYCKKHRETKHVYFESKFVGGFKNYREEMIRMSANSLQILLMGKIKTYQIIKAEGIANDRKPTRSLIPSLESPVQTIG